MTTTTGVRIRVLGAMEVCLDGTPVSIGSAIQRAILGLLAVDLGESISAGRLLEGAWPDGHGKKASLHVHVSALRRVLEPGHQPGSPFTVIESTETGYRLNLAPKQVDYHQFRNLVAQAGQLRETDPEAALGLYRDAELLVKGDLLEEVDHDSALALAHRFEETRLQALEARIELELAIGDVAHLPGELSQLASAFPTREQFALQWMMALVAMNRRADAINAYHCHRENLAELTGLEPSAELQALERAILVGGDDTTTVDEPIKVDETDGVLLYVEADTHRGLVSEPAPDLAPAGGWSGELLRSVVTAHRGRIEQPQGRCFIARFATVAQAAAAAVDFQLRTPAPVDRRGGAVGGIDRRSGGIDRRGGGVAGVDGVGIRAVLAPAGEPGALPGEEQARLMAPYAPSGGVLFAQPLLAEIIAAGYHPNQITQLRGHIRLGTIALYTINRRGLTAASACRIHHPLPHRTEPLVGRDHDLDEITAKLAAGQVTISGPPGVGKSTILVELAHRIGPTYRDGFCYIDLARVDDADTMAALATALGIDFSESLTVDGLLASLVGRHRMVAIDSAEQHRGTVAELVVGRHRLGVSTVLAVASTQVLGVENERVHTLAPLSCDETTVDGTWWPSPAMCLLTNRLADLGVGLGVGIETNRLLAVLSRQVDGLPLALEALAERLRCTPLPELHHEIACHGSLAAMPDRFHQAFTAVIEGIHASLNDQTKRAFEGLGAFASADYSPSALSAITGLSRATVTGVLASLADRSLVSVLHHSSQSRYTSLDLIRQYARRKLDEANQLEQAVDRYAAHLRPRPAAPAAGCGAEREKVKPGPTGALTPKGPTDLMSLAD